MELKLISSPQDVLALRTELNQFEQDVYNQAFPDQNERESFEDIFERIGLSADTKLSSYMVAAFDQSKVVGLLVADYYSRSESLELIYIVVDRTNRKSGVGSALIEEGVALIVNHVAKVQNVFFETNNMSDKVSLDDTFKPRIRTRFFRNLEAKQIVIDYVQPPLGEGKSYVDNLNLMVFPKFCVDSSKIKTESLKLFLEDFYLGLNCRHDNERLLQMYNDIDRIAANGYVKFGEILCSNYEFEQAKVTLHFKMEGVPKDWSTPPSSCAIFGSYQTDLMNYRSQPNQKLKTVFYKNIEGCELHMPLSFSYRSEGMQYRRRCDSDRQTISVDIAICYCYNSLSDSYIANLSISPAKEAYFSELDIIKLCTSFGSKQEDYRADAITIKYKSTDPQDFIQFLKSNLCDAEYLYTGNGISQIIAKDECFFGADLYDSFIFGKQGSITKHTERFLRAMCGIILGIFDYERMNLSEIKDTIQPIVVQEDSFVVLCRGNLFKWATNIDSEICDFSIISPYLLLPSCVLTFNEQIITRCESKITEQSLINSEKTKGQVIAEVEAILNTKYIDNIFQYPSEKMIVKRGINQRNLQERCNQIVKDVELIRKNLSISRRRYVKAMDKIQASLLLIVAVTQIIMTILELVNNNNQNKMLIYGLTVSSILLVIIFGIISYRLESGFKE